MPTDIRDLMRVTATHEAGALRSDVYQPVSCRTWGKRFRWNGVGVNPDTPVLTRTRYSVSLRRTAWPVVPNESQPDEGRS